MNEMWKYMFLKYFIFLSVNSPTPPFLIGIANIHISTIVLLNAGTVPTVWYIFFHFIIGYEKKNWVAIVKVEASHHLILIRLYFILTILITEDDDNHIFF
jgi:hypothetical protein